MKTIRSEQVGKTTIRLVEVGGGYVGLVLAGGKKLAELSGTDPAQLWADLRQEVGRSAASYFGYDEARRLFLSFFPDGLHSPAFEQEERDYKLLAKARLDAAAPLEAAATEPGYAEAALAAIRATNLIYPVEKARAQEMLRGPHGDSFVRAAARFALGETKALADMERVMRTYDNARWTVATYLPFLWRPEAHMFLKPQVTCDYAERVGHPFAHHYQSGLDLAVYDSLLDLTARTRALLDDLSPRDNIDIQSFIWVIGDYQPGTDGASVEGQ